MRKLMLDRWNLVSKSLLAAASTLLLSFGLACSQNQQPSSSEQPASSPNEAQSQEEMQGYAIALAPTANSSATGTVMVMPMGDGVHFSGVVSGLTPGEHAVHVHEKGDCSAPDGSSAGGHFNPLNVAHGAPTAQPHHAGDLGNVIAGADGRTEINIHASGITLEAGDNSIRDRALIVHSAGDDFTTQPTGNAGGRLACGVIQATN